MHGGVSMLLYVGCNALINQCTKNNMETFCSVCRRRVVTSLTHLCFTCSALTCNCDVIDLFV